MKLQENAHLKIYPGNLETVFSGEKVSKNNNKISKDGY